jgi:hypothetical protein
MSVPTVSTSTALACRNCGGSPAAKVTFKSVQGFLIFSRVSTLRGVYCRDCGQRAKAEMNAKMFKGAWFSVTALAFMPIYLAMNASAAGKLDKLSA